jgi:hypothetical protein
MCKTVLVASCIALIVGLATWLAVQAVSQSTAAERAEPMVVHDVYFTLKDNSPAARQKLVEACKKYLSKHPGTVFFAAGTLAEELKRDVNDRDFDVGLHVVFKDKASHDKYQDAPLHKQFIDENKASWKKVRVFDTTAEQ